jgi:septal ring factor EnvC (AmiA/AmiB activator)
VSKRINYTILFVLLNLFFLHSQDQKKNELESVRKKTIEEIEFATKMIEENQAKSKESLNQLSLVNHKIKMQNRLIETLAEEIEVLDQQIGLNNSSIVESRQKQDKIKSEYAKSIYLTYQKRTRNSFVLYILASDNFNLAYKRFRYIQIVNSYRKKQVALLLDLEQQIKEENQKLEEKKRDRQNLHTLHEKENVKLANEKIKQKGMLTKLQKQEKDLKAELEKKKRIAREIEREIEKIILAERKKSSKGDIYATLTKEEKLISDEFGKNLGKLPWPTKQGVVVGKFGEQDHPSIKGIKVRNDGIYIATVKNAEVRCVFTGVVTRIFSIPGENYSVIIKHGNYYTLYHNLKDVRVSTGNELRTKDVIGSVATDMDKNEAILHFQIWKETERNDPELWLSH